MDFGAILNGVIGTVIGGAIVWLLVKLPLQSLLDELKRLKQLVEERHEVRLSKAESEIGEIKERCAARGPQVENHERALSGVNVPLINERIGRAIDTALEVECRIAEVGKQLPEVLLEMRKLCPEVKDLRRYIRNVSRQARERDHALECRMARQEGVPQPAPLPPREQDFTDQEDANAA